MSLFEKAKAIINNTSPWEDFSEVCSCPEWDFINSQDKLTAVQKFCICALSHQAQTHHELVERSGILGSEGTFDGVKVFWRDVANKLCSTDRYRPIYKEQLDVEYKKNERRNSARKSQLSKLKFRARMYTMSQFFGDLIQSRVEAHDG
jgi:hypothetical protein